MRRRCAVLVCLGFVGCSGRDGPTEPTEAPPSMSVFAPSRVTGAGQTNEADVLLQDLIHRLVPALDPSGSALLTALQAIAALPAQGRAAAVEAAEPLLAALEKQASPEARPEVDAIRLEFDALIVAAARTEGR